MCNFWGGIIVLGGFGIELFGLRLLIGGCFLWVLVIDWYVIFNVKVYYI